MNHKFRIIIFILIVTLAGAILIAKQTQAPTQEIATNTETPPPRLYRDLIEVTSPTSFDRMASPIVIEGRARGTWYFEASFPIELVDANGETIGSTTAQAQDEWMTEDFVSFSSTLTFEKPKTETGTLRLKKDNPSGDPANDDVFEIPVTFEK